MSLSPDSRLRRRVLAGLAALAASTAMPGGLTGCSRVEPLTIGIHTWIGYETLFLARTFGWLPTTAHLHEGQNATDSLQALSTGQVEAACLTLDEVLRARGLGVPLQVVLIFNVSAGSDKIIVREGITTPEDLFGRRLGLERHALGEVMLASFLRANQLQAMDLELVDLSPDQQLAAWQAGAIDALITYEPTASHLLRAGGQVLFDSRRLPDTIVDVLAVQPERVRRQRTVLEGVIQAHFRSLEHLRNHWQDALYRIAARQGVPVGDVELALAGVQLPSLAANHSYLAFTDERLLRSARFLQEVMAARGISVDAGPLTDLLTPMYLPRQI